MSKKRENLILASFLCILLSGIAGCGEVQGARNVDTTPTNDREGDGPGLFSGKEGGFVIYQHVWSGSAPGGGESE